tara:strand:+ start:39 stop:1667 length:1629 start_codon:yes stop_codon:yes gene_type:complete
MATTSTYPIVTPKVEDLIVGTQTYTEEDPVLDNPTSNFTIGSLVSLVESSVGVNKIIAGQGLTISPSNGKGDVTISAPTAPQWLTSDAVVTNGVVNYVSNLLIPTGSTSIGDYAFLNMNIDAIDFNNQSITSIGANAFAINKLKGTLALPSTLLTIGDYAFQDLVTTTNKIELIEFGNQLTTIGQAVFQKNAITSLSIPSSVTTIGNYAFDRQLDNLNTNTLTSLTFESRTTALTLGSYAFSYNAITSVNIPANTITGYGAFTGNTSMSSVTIGDNSTISQNSFYGNYNISSLTIGNNVSFSSYNNFGVDASFPPIDLLTSVNLPSTTTFAYAGTFGNRKNLTTFTVANGANSFWPQTINSGVVPNSMFYNCGLTEVSIDSNVTVGVSSFRGNALTSISIGENVMLSSNAFAFNATINTLTIPGTTTFIPVGGSTGPFYGNGVSSITNLIIEEGVTEITRYSFYNQSIQSIVFPSSIVEIEEDAFRVNNISGTLTFASVITIGQRAFKTNPGITTVNVPIGSNIDTSSNNGSFDSGVTINYV